ncbi:MAG: protein translocase subunit SecF [Desulfovibrio sp.]|nr:MAG: protein translocase subunit SecF [Desulfovibrio sp.]
MGFSFIRPDTNINFVGARFAALVVSAVLILAGLGSLAVKGGPRLGIDFAGGASMKVKFAEAVEAGQVREALSGHDLPDFVVQSFGQEGDNEYLVRISSFEVEEADFLEPLQAAFNVVDIEFEMVGPGVSAELRSNALEALFYAVLLIGIYISGRFEQRWMAAGIMAAGLLIGIKLIGAGYEMIFDTGIPMSYTILGAMIIVLILSWYLKLNYALGAVVALIHDVLITVGVFSLLNKEFDLTNIAALLTIIGYSLNDTIIVYDRIRENIHTKYQGTFGQLINRSINQTLSRTLLTSGTTFAVVLCLFILGGGVIHDFALALMIGVVVGTYSSIFVASPILLALVPQEQRVPQVKGSKAVAKA